MEVRAYHDGFLGPTFHGYNEDMISVWVIVERLTKSAHFLAVRMTFTLEEFCRVYIREIVLLHGVSVSIVSDRDPKFTTHFWKSFQKAMGTQLTMSTAFHL